MQNKHTAKNLQISCKKLLMCTDVTEKKRIHLFTFVNNIDPFQQIRRYERFTEHKYVYIYV